MILRVIGGEVNIPTTLGGGRVHAEVSRYLTAFSMVGMGVHTPCHISSIS